MEIKKEQVGNIQVVTVGGRLGEDHVGRTALGVLLRLREWIAMRQLASRVQRQHFFVPGARALGDTA